MLERFDELLRDEIVAPNLQHVHHDQGDHDERQQQNDQTEDAGRFNHPGQEALVFLDHRAVFTVAAFAPFVAAFTAVDLSGAVVASFAAALTASFLTVIILKGESGRCRHEGNCHEGNQEPHSNQTQGRIPV